VASEWDWVFDGAMSAAGSLMFIRGVSPERVMDAYAVNPAPARVLPATQAIEALRHPVTDRKGRVIYPWIRAGRAGDWAFAIDETWPGCADDEAAIGTELSAGTELAWCSWADGQGSFSYVVDGHSITWFDPWEAWKRFGRKPDFFLASMQQAGLQVDPPRRKAPPSPPRDPWIALLEMLTTTLGIRLSRQVALGPLLTAQRDLATEWVATYQDDDEAATSEWAWFREAGTAVGGTLMFARGASAGQVIEAFAIAPGARHNSFVPASKVSGVLRYPVCDDAGTLMHPWIRVGMTGEWAFAIDESAAGWGGYEDDCQGTSGLPCGRTDDLPVGGQVMSVLAVS
jgi:hypothetical protein